MDTKKIKEIFNSVTELRNSHIDITKDPQGNFKGYITSDYFESKQNDEAQEFLWDILEENLEEEELLTILAIFHETPKERVKRLFRNSNGIDEIIDHKIFFHETPNLSRYWGFIDVTKFKTGEYRAISIVINEKEKLSKVLIFHFEKKIIDFMKLEKQAAYNEVYERIYENMQVEVDIHLMDKYDKEVESKKLFGEQNIYFYIFRNKNILKPINKSKIQFNKNEVKMIINATKEVKNLRFVI